MIGRLRASMTIAVGTLLAAGLLSAAPTQAAEPPLVIWASPDVVPQLEATFAQGFRDRAVIVQARSLDEVVAQLPTVAPEAAPDVVMYPGQVTGAWAAAGLLRPLSFGAKVRNLFPANVLAGVQAPGGTYGIPVAVDSVALISNAELVPKHPTTFAQLSRRALRVVARGKATMPFAMAQGEAGDVRATYPLFSGLGGYLFGTTPEGLPDVANVGIASPTLIANAASIRIWNRSRLIRAEITADAARKAFIAGRAPFWLARTSDLPTILKLGFRHRITAVPPIVAGLTPITLLDVTAFGVTRYAAAHGVTRDAKALVTRMLSTTAVQAGIAADLGLLPAATAAVSALSADPAPARIRAFGLAAANGIAVPPVVAMDAVWVPLGSAWVSSTAGSSATPARQAFRQAQAAVLAALG